MFPIPRFDVELQDIYRLYLGAGDCDLSMTVVHTESTNKDWMTSTYAKNISAQFVIASNAQNDAILLIACMNAMAKRQLKLA